MPVTHEVASSSLVGPAIKREPFMGSFLMAEMIVVRIAYASSADFRTDDTNNNNLGELVRIARIPNWLSHKAHKLGYSSVEEIQDEPRRSRHLRKNKSTSWTYFFVKSCGIKRRELAKGGSPSEFERPVSRVRRSFLWKKRSF